jgi:hypothetical protein
MNGIRIGAIVTHRTWGVGKVLFVTDSKAVVVFPTCRQGEDTGVREVSLRGAFIELAHNEPDPVPDNWNLTLDTNGHVVKPKVRASRAKKAPVAAPAAAAGE